MSDVVSSVPYVYSTVWYGTVQYEGLVSDRVAGLAAISDAGAGRQQRTESDSTAQQYRWRRQMLAGETSTGTVLYCTGPVEYGGIVPKPAVACR